MEQLLAIVVLILGLWGFIDPKSFIDMKVRWAKVFGVKMIPSKKTYKIYKYVGLVIALAGAYFLFF